MSAKNPFFSSVVLPLMLLILLLVSSCNDSGEVALTPTTPEPNDFYWDKVGNLLFTITFENDSVYSTRCFLVQVTNSHAAIAVYNAVNYRLEQFERFKRIEVTNYHTSGSSLYSWMYKNNLIVYDECVTSAVYEDQRITFTTGTDTVSFQMNTNDYYQLFERCLAGENK